MQMRPQAQKGLLPGMNGHSQQPRPAVRAFTDVSVSLRIADLRREIEGIQEQNKIYRFRESQPVSCAHRGILYGRKRSLTCENIFAKVR
jgi:hypothetical protein